MAPGRRQTGGDDRLDRLLHHCDVVSINGPRYPLSNRLKAIEPETKWPDEWDVRTQASGELRLYAGTWCFLRKLRHTTTWVTRGMVAACTRRCYRPRMKRPMIAVLIVFLMPLAACQAPENGTTSTPRPHISAGIDGESFSEDERLYLDKVLETASGTKSGMKWRKAVIAGDKGDLDMLLDGERLDFCNDTPRRNKEDFIEKMGRDEGIATFYRQEATLEHLC